jgi:hypothetical protein
MSIERIGDRLQGFDSHELLISHIPHRDARQLAGVEPEELARNASVELDAAVLIVHLDALARAMACTLVRP